MVPHRGKPSNESKANLYITFDKGGGGSPGSVLGASLRKLYSLKVNSRGRGKMYKT